MKLPTEPREPDIGTPEDWERIEQALGFKDFDPQRRQMLWGQIRSIFNYFKPQGWPEVRTANYHHALEALKRHAVRLFVDLSPNGKLDGSGDGTSSRIICDDPDNLPADKLDDLDLWALAYLSGEILPSAKRKVLLEGLAELIEAADKESAALPKDKGGRDKDWRLQGTIYLLSQLYAEMSGKKPGISRHPNTHQPSGPFLRFVSECLQMFAPEPTRDNQALAKTIQRVLKIKRWRTIL